MPWRQRSQQQQGAPCCPSRRRGPRSLRRRQLCWWRRYGAAHQVVGECAQRIDLARDGSAWLHAYRCACGTLWASTVFVVVHELLCVCDMCVINVQGRKHITGLSLTVLCLCMGVWHMFSNLSSDHFLGCHMWFFTKNKSCNKLFHICNALRYQQALPCSLITAHKWQALPCMSGRLPGTVQSTACLTLTFACQARTHAYICHAYKGRCSPKRMGSCFYFQLRKTQLMPRAGRVQQVPD